MTHPKKERFKKMKQISRQQTPVRKKDFKLRELRELIYKKKKLANLAAACKCHSMLPRVYGILAG